MATDRRRQPLAILALAAIVAAAVALRVIGLRYGLPAVYNPDEVAIMNRALAFGQGDLNPHNFLYPTLYLYVLFVWEGAWFIVGHIFGIFPSLQDFERGFFVDPSLIYVAGRTLTAVCGVVTVWVTYRLGTRLFGRGAGLFAAALLAVAPLAVTDAHYVKHDVPVTLAILVAHLWLAALLLDARLSGKPWPWIIAGALAGVAMTTHYYAVFVALPVVLTALLAGDRRHPVRPTRIARLLLAGGGSALLFFAGSPFLAMEPRTAWRDVVANRQIVMDRATNTAGLFGSLGFYARWLAHDAAGTTTIVLALVGIVVVCRANWRIAAVMSIFPLAFLLFIANTFPASRYLNPVLPFATLFAGTALSWAWRRGSLPRLVSIALCGAAIVEAGTESVRTDRFFQQTDTRTLAQQWIEREVPAGTSVLIQPYSVALRMSRDALVEGLTLHEGSAARASTKFQRELALDPYPAPAYRTIYLGTGGEDEDKIYVAPSALAGNEALLPIRALGIRYVILKEFAEPDPALAALEAALGREGAKVATFSPYRESAASKAPRPAPFIHDTNTRIDSALERPGPAIDIWRIE